MIELSQLRVFVAAAEEKNFSRAARRLHLTQSAVSQNIQAIERMYGVQLFLRRGRSVQLSEAGQSILPLAYEVLNTARLFDDALRNIHGYVGGEILLGCSTTAGKYLLPNLVAAFRRSYPDVRVRVNVMNRQMVIDQLLGQKIVYGIVSKRIEHRLLELRPLFEDHVILIVPADHPWGQCGRVTPQDLQDQLLIMREETSGTREVLCEGLQAHGITPDMLNVVMELGNAEAIEIAVEEGIGIAFVSEVVAARGIALGR
ncbi:MAG: LysR family transcriptional regulator, partial [Anaerolineae bacterium]